MTGPEKELKTVTVVCEKHGLRYNPQIHSGCVRCRKEAGETIGGPVAAPAAKSAPQGGSLVAALAVTFFLVAITSLVFYTVHKSAWDAAQRARESWLEEGGSGELTPEQQEQLRKLEEMLDGMSDR